MYTDNSEPGRFAMQAQTAEEMTILSVVEEGAESHPDIKRAFWTFDVPDYPGLNRLLWHQKEWEEPGGSALVIDYETGETGA